MNYIREKVAGKKKRLIQEGYNLDLTYVTKRIIAMSYPGEGFEGFYRNPIE
jgi:phosphatidylinositol-3,4,5-trisphosphate 3-phosphatase/dual-specificity protein phosphatase PTEN